MGVLLLPEPSVPEEWSALDHDLPARSDPDAPGLLHRHQNSSSMAPEHQAPHKPSPPSPIQQPEEMQDQLARLDYVVPSQSSQSMSIILP